MEDVKDRFGAPLPERRKAGRKLVCRTSILTGGVNVPYMVHNKRRKMPTDDLALARKRQKELES